MVQRPGGRCLSRTPVITSGNCSQVFHYPQIASSAGSLNPGRFRRQSSARKFATRSRVIAPVSRPAYITPHDCVRRLQRSSRSNCRRSFHLPDGEVRHSDPPNLAFFLQAR
jgi:hypothetical protein